MAQLNLQLSIKKRWCFRLMLFASVVGLHLGIIRPKRNPEWVGGFEPADHRAARWLVDNGMVLTALAEGQ